ncbi:GNAT family N-acetyltransferase [Hazenella coriacea]|uniref:Ribosomal-protein-serine acetyltransferase n=1 Tax=Hazenella coriacea TaxID=1179467 RepID=A0A4R3L4N0_9BACL|nr:GNAT family protein [Hazenella coriacea]TCS94751.1 ribosomal-protein-serine acetyltransferase [Hazenella coriacea]
MFSYFIDDELSLVLLQKKDAPVIYQLIDKNRSHLREWLPWVDSTKSVEDSVTVIQMWLQSFANEDGFSTGISYKGEIVGIIGFHKICQRNRSSSIGYWLSKDAQGKGIMTRACRALIEIGFREYDLHRIEIRCGEENHKSRLIPERLGFKQEGIIKDGEWLYNRFHNLVIYGLTKDQYQAIDSK